MGAMGRRGEISSTGECGDNCFQIEGLFEVQVPIRQHSAPGELFVLPIQSSRDTSEGDCQNTYLLSDQAPTLTSWSTTVVEAAMPPTTTVPSLTSLVRLETRHVPIFPVCERAAVGSDPAPSQTSTPTTELDTTLAQSSIKYLRYKKHQKSVAGVSLGINQVLTVLLFLGQMLEALAESSTPGVRGGRLDRYYEDVYQWRWVAGDSKCQGSYPTPSTASCVSTLAMPSSLIQTLLIRAGISPNPGPMSQEDKKLLERLKAEEAAEGRQSGGGAKTNNNKTPQQTPPQPAAVSQVPPSLPQPSQPAAGRKQEKGRKEIQREKREKEKERQDRRKNEKKEQEKARKEQARKEKGEKEEKEAKEKKVTTSPGTQVDEAETAMAKVLLRQLSEEVRGQLISMIATEHAASHPAFQAIDASVGNTGANPKTGGGKNKRSRGSRGGKKNVGVSGPRTEYSAVSTRAYSVRRPYINPGFKSNIKIGERESKGNCVFATILVLIRELLPPLDETWSRVRPTIRQLFEGLYNDDKSTRDLAYADLISTLTQNEPERESWSLTEGMSEYVRVLPEVMELFAIRQHNRYEDHANTNGGVQVVAQHVSNGGKGLFVEGVMHCAMNGNTNVRSRIHPTASSHIEVLSRFAVIEVSNVDYLRQEGGPGFSVTNFGREGLYWINGVRYTIRAVVMNSGSYWYTMLRRRNCGYIVSNDVSVKRVGPKARDGHMLEAMDHATAFVLEAMPDIPGCPFYTAEDRGHEHGGTGGRRNVPKQDSEEDDLSPA